MFNCPECRNGACQNCPDRILLILGRDLVCSCTKANHQELVSGEPRLQQIEDPFTGDVHGPGMVVSAEDGQVKFTGGQ